MEEAKDQQGRGCTGTPDVSMRTDTTESAYQSSALEIEDGVSVSEFDYSAENFLADMGDISALCGASGEEESFEASEVQRFSSTITFLKEWMQYYYKPKAINFSYETGSTVVEDVTKGISLSQFSSAAVPKMEQLPDKTRFLDSKDFILHAGGPVWALDWCPRIPEISGCNIKCEYLAVAAHPPGSTYNNIGVPLIGRGVIQIWCLLSKNEKVEFLPPRLKGKGRRINKAVREESVDGISSEKGVFHIHPGNPRGRPRKRPILGLNGVNGSFLARPRGRPRKQSLPSVTSLSGKEESLPCSNNSIPSVIESIPPSSVDFTEVALAFPGAADLTGKTESLVPKRRGRPRKKPIPCVHEYVPASGVELGEGASAFATSRGLGSSTAKGLSIDSVEVALKSPGSANFNGKGEPYVPKRRGRPRKKPILNGNEAPTSGCKFGDDVSALSTPRGLWNSRLNDLSVDLEEVPLTMLAPADFNAKQESSLPRRRGRPRKKPIQNAKECVPTSSVDVGEDASELSTSRRLVDSSLNVLSINLEEVPLALPASADINSKDESIVPRHRGIPRRKPISNVNVRVPESGVKLGEDASSLPTSRLKSSGLVNSSMNGASADLEEFTLALPVSSFLNGKENSSVPSRRGRRRKKPIPTVNECVTEFGVKLDKDASALSTLGLDNLSANGVLGGCSIDKGLVMETCDGFNKGTIDIKSGVTACIKKQRISNKAKFVTSNNATGQTLPIVVPESCEDAVLEICQRDDGFAMEMCEGLNNDQLAINSGQTACVRKRKKDKARAVGCSYPILSTTSQDKQLSSTIEPTHDSHFQGAAGLRENAGQNRPSKANTTSSVIPKGLALPRVVLCLAHNGKVAWDVKWKPPNVNDSEGKNHMGYLAVLLGNGSLEVWEVPPPSMVKKLYASCCSGSTDPRFLKLEPVFRCSMVKCGDRQSIPLTVEWSPSAPCDLILAGCHDGTVAMWKFSTQYSSQDTKPLLCFSADSVPIRALAWAPDESDAEAANLIVTAGHEGLKFWDIRDPYRPLWELNPVQRVILSLDWLKDPRCIILAFDDGTLRTISLWNSAYDVPVTGKPFVGTKLHAMRNYQCSSFAIWSVQVSRNNGIVAYCSADGFALRFQLTHKSVDKDGKRYREPHFLCGSLTEEGQTLKIYTPSPSTPLLDFPFSMKRSFSECGDAPRNLRDCLSSDANQAHLANSQFPALCSGDRSVVLGSGNSQTPPIGKTVSKPISSKKKKAKPGPSPISGTTVSPGGEAEQGALQSSENQDRGSERKVEVFPPKSVAMHRVRWNMNKGSERWLCYGGAAGLIRCQEIPLPTTP